jgi:hypothetical protein
LGPALRWYARALTNAPARPARREALHLVPALLWWSAAIASTWQPPDAPQAELPSEFNWIALAPSALHVLAYLLVVLRMIWRHAAALRALQSRADPQALSWLAGVAALAAALLGLWIVSWFMPAANADLMTGVAFVVATGWIGWRGLRQEETPGPPDAASNETAPGPRCWPMSRRSRCSCGSRRP